MKLLLLLLLLSPLSYAGDYVYIDNDMYQIHQDKTYKMQEVNGKLLTSNEYTPLQDKDYTDGYKVSKEFKVIKDANERLKKIRGGL